VILSFLTIAIFITQTVKSKLKNKTVWWIGGGGGGGGGGGSSSTTSSSGNFNIYQHAV